jgi:hypothetical protein
MALQGILAGETSANDATVASCSYTLADAMLAARKGGA